MAEELFPGAMTILYATAESSYGSPMGIKSADAMFTISESLTPQEERDNRPDRSGSADHTERYVGRMSAEWEATMLLLTAGAVGTEPDAQVIWKNAFGNASNNAAIVEYHMATAHSASMTIRRGQRTGQAAGTAEFQDHVVGAIASRTEISWGSQGNNGLAQVSFSGPAKKWGYTGNTSMLTASGAVTATEGQVTVDSGRQLTPGSLVKFGSSQIGTLNAGITLNTVAASAISWGVTLSASAATSDTVAPYNPTATTSGSPIHGRLGSLSLDGGSSTIRHLGGRVTLEDNRGLLNEEVGVDSPSRVLREDRRNVTFSLEFLMKKEEVPDLLGDMRRNLSENMKVTIGETAGSIIDLVMINTEFDMGGIDVPDQGMLRVTLNGVALGTNGNDSLRVKMR